MLIDWLRWQNVVDFIVLSIAFYLVLLWAKQTRAADRANSQGPAAHPEIDPINPI